jgi:hypothetical protein
MGPDTGPRYVVLFVVNADRPDHRRVYTEKFYTLKGANEAALAAIGQFVTATIIEDF